MTKLMFACLFAIAACGGGNKKSDTMTTTDPNTTTTNTDGDGSAAATGEGTPCSQEVALQCPEGQIDGCLKQPAEGETHACVAN